MHCDRFVWIAVSCLLLALPACGPADGEPGPADTTEPVDAVDLTDSGDVQAPPDGPQDVDPVEDGDGSANETPQPEDVIDDHAPELPGPDPDVPVQTACNEEDLGVLYTLYVEPFVSGAIPTSCSQCHMTGIDISLYVQDTPCQTMACMLDSGVVDFEDPLASELLAMIMMGDPSSSVFDVSTEHQAILAWIAWSADCHGALCGEIESACDTGTGAPSTGMTPLGDCSEDDLLASFWDAVIVDKQRCFSCHSDEGAKNGVFGPCTADSQCDGNQECLEGFCTWPGPYYAPHFFEGLEGPLVWSNPEHKQHGLNAMYNILALGVVDEVEPLDSYLLVKPLLEDFHPTAIYGPGVDIPQVPDGVGVGVTHGGSSKFNFGCKKPPCPTEGVVDCRTDTFCNHGSDCEDGFKCEEHSCRLAGSVCDATYVNYVRFIETYVGCKGASVLP